MARIRTIKPEFWTDEKVVTLPFSTRLIFIGLWNFADDEGRLAYEPMRIRLQIMPNNPELDMEHELDLLVAAGLLDLYDVAGGPSVLVIHGFTKHQKISHPTPSRLDISQGKKRGKPSAPENSGELRKPPARIAKGIAIGRDIDIPSPVPRARDGTESEREPDTPRLADVPGFRKISDLVSGKCSGRGGRYAEQSARDEYATAKCKEHLPIGDALRREMIALAAEDPHMEGHDEAVRLMLRAAKRAGVGWVSPERRHGNGA